MSKLIVVCGLPGSGKTTLAAGLSRRLNIVCLHKDSIKESLYESFGCKTAEENKKIGGNSVRLLLELAAEQIKRGVDISIESPFNFPADYPTFSSWIQGYGVEMSSVICSVNAAVREARFVNRTRHEAHSHFDQQVIRERAYFSETYDYSEIPGKHIQLDTDSPLEELVEKVLKELV